MRKKLERKVITWADEKGIFEKSDSSKQLKKTMEECQELIDALEIYKTNLTLENFHDVVMEYGDVLVTLVLFGHFLQIDSFYALSIAYDKINKREGKMIDGFFVKEE